MHDKIELRVQLMSYQDRGCGFWQCSAHEEGLNDVLSY